MKSLLKTLGAVLWLMLIAAVTGCATTDADENAADRPWNAPQHWEHGLPPSIMEGR